MADIRLIVTDLDGTFLTGHNDPHPENVRALKEAQQAGILVCACTGRAWNMCRHVVKKSGFDRYTITSGGSAIVDAHTQQPLFQRTMQPTALLPLLYTAWRTGIARMDVFNTAFTGSFGQGLEDKVLRVRVRNAVMPQDEWEDFRAYRKFLDLFYAMEDKSELVYLTTGNERGDMPDKLREIIDALDAFDLTVSAAGCIDVLPRGCDKSTALIRLCRMLGIAREEVLAIGDQENDIPMLRWAGVGVAMGQSDEKVKRAADRVTAHYKDAGVAKAIYEVALDYCFDD